MKRTTSLIALLLALPAPYPFAGFSDDAAASSGAFGGFDDVDESNPVIAILGDTQMTGPWEFWFKKNDAQTRLLLAEIAFRGPAALINLGDLVASGASTVEWQIFDNLHAPVMGARIPYFAVHGNHDYRGPDDQAREHFERRFPHLQGREWHAFRFRYAGIILLDSNFAVLGREKANAETRWLEETLAEMEASPEIQVVICCAHHPPYSNSSALWPRLEVQRRFARAFNRLRKPGLFFSGHIHTYERFYIDQKYYIVSGGGGGHPCRVKIGPGRRVISDVFQGPEVRPFHFCELDFRTDRLVFRSLHLESRVASHFVIADEFTIPVEAPIPVWERVDRQAVAPPAPAYEPAFY